MQKISIALFLLAIFLLYGCSKKEMNNIENNQDVTNHIDITFETITQEKAYNIMQTDENCIILDVRAESEYKEGHIPNAILLPHDTINENTTKILTDKNQTILVYCRSGRRSTIAAQTLVDLGYTNVKDFGGIVDWQYEIITK